MHQSAFDKMKVFVDKYLINYADKDLKILDIGSCVKEHQFSQKNLFERVNWTYIGMDIENGENVDIVVNDPYDWKEIESNYFDVVISNQTFEHIPFFWNTLFEIGRVLKEGGLVCIIAPSSGSEHRYPLDTFRYYPDGFSNLVDYIDFKKIEVYRQDIDLQYTDGSDFVKDCCLIMQKPIFNESERINFIIKNFMHKMLLKKLSFDSLVEIEKSIKTILESNEKEVIKSYLFNSKSKNIFKELEVELSSKISNFSVRKKKIKACITILISNIFGKKFAKYIFKIYPKMEYWS